MRRTKVFSVVAGLLAAGFAVCGFAAGQLSNLQPFTDPSGTFRTFSKGSIQLSNPFFTSLGSNDRTCASCHDPSDGWSITPAHLEQRFQTSQGMDQVFLASDG